MTCVDTAQYRLYNELFSDYEPHLRPVHIPADSVVVSLEFELNTVSGLVSVIVYVGIFRGMTV